MMDRKNYLERRYVSLFLFVLFGFSLFIISFMNVGLLLGNMLSAAVVVIGIGFITLMWREKKVKSVMFQNNVLAMLFFIGIITQIYSFYESIGGQHATLNFILILELSLGILNRYV